MRSQIRPGMDRTKITSWCVRTVGKKRARRSWLTKEDALKEARKAIVRAGGTGNIYIHDRNGAVENVHQLLDVPSA